MPNKRFSERQERDGEFTQVKGRRRDRISKNLEMLPLWG